MALKFSIPKIRFPYVHKQYVSWGEMDAFQHINHVVYVKYFENARVEFLKDVGIWDPGLNGEYGPIVAKLDMQFKKQVRYPAQLDVTIGLLELQSRSFSFGCTMWDDNNDLVYLAVGDFYWIHFPTGKVVSLPKEYIEKFKPYVVNKNKIYK
ncbi:MAG: thioesterase [Leptospiraceae bacterium]|nr:MAG: thioesterase [Leptospiraceae bacterium]